MCKAVYLLAEIPDLKSEITEHPFTKFSSNCVVSNNVLSSVLRKPPSLALYCNNLHKYSDADICTPQQINSLAPGRSSYDFENVIFNLAWYLQIFLW